MLNNALMFNVMILMCYVNILMYCIICCCIQHDIHGIYQSCCPGPCPQGVLKDKFKEALQNIIFHSNKICCKNTAQSLMPSFL